MRSIFDEPTIESIIKVRRTKWHCDSPDIIPLWLADQDYQLYSELKQTLHDAVDEENTVYATNLDAREAMKTNIKRYNNVSVPIDQIILQRARRYTMFFLSSICIVNCPLGVVEISVILDNSYY